MLSALLLTRVILLSKSRFLNSCLELYEHKPNAIKPFVIRISLLLETANINPNNIEKHFITDTPLWCIRKSRSENPQTLTQLSPRSHPRHLVGKRTAQKDTTKDITSDSQVNSYFRSRWSPAILTFSIYFYLFLYLYITRIIINIGTPDLKLKSPKNQNRRAALGRPAIKLLEGGGFN